MRPKGSSLERGLIDFVRVIPHRSVIAEVGCFLGESTLFFFAKAFKIFCIDPWSDYVEVNSPDQIYHMVGMGLIEKQFDARFVALIQCGKVVKCKMTSVEASVKLNRLFDVVYLDGNHALESILEDIRVWLPKVKPGGMLAGHDYDRESVRQAVNRLLGPPDSTFQDNTWMKRL